MIYLSYIYKLNRKSKLEKKHSPEVDSNHNEEHNTKPCGFVTKKNPVYKISQNVYKNSHPNLESNFFPILPGL